MNILDQRTARVLATLILFAAVGGFIYGGRHTIIAFLFAIFFAYLVGPLVSLVQRRSPLSKGSRGRAILQVYIILIGLFALLITIGGPRLAREARSFSQTLPTLLHNVQTGQIAHQIGARRGWSYNTQARTAEFISAHQQQIMAFASDFGARAAELAKNAIWLILIPILAVFFLRDGSEISESLVGVIERRRQRQFLRGIISDLNDMLGAYIRAQLILAGISMVVYTAVLEIMRVPYAIILGVIGGVLEFVPVLGPLIAAVSILGVAFIANYQHLLILLLFLGAWRLVQDYVNSPRIMGGKLELHPLAALFAVLVGGEIAGVLGVYLSIPAMATLRILWRRYQRYGEAQTVTAASEVRPSDLRLA